MEKKYWSSLNTSNDLKKQIHANGKHNGKSFLETIDAEFTQKPSSRRNFLKLCGFSVATAAIASSCENPVKKAIPYLNKPEEVTLGLANHYATTFFDGYDYNSIIVKVRDGRPIKIEGNPMSNISKGRTTARVQASILSLYDNNGRLKNPLKDKTKITWDKVDSDIISRLINISEAGQQTVLLTGNIISPSTKALIEEFFKIFPGKHVMYEPVSSSGMLIANQSSFGIKAIPDYRFDKAKVIVAFSADFLGTWLSPCEFAYRYGMSKDLQNDNQDIAKHYQFESGLTITGSKADKRFPIKSSDEPALILQLHNEILRLSGEQPGESSLLEESIASIATELWDHKGQTIVISGSNDVNVQIVVNSINNLLGNYNNTIDFGTALLTQQALDQEMEDLITQMNDNTVGGLILWNVNPVYDYHNPDGFVSGLTKMKLTVSFNNTINETNQHFRYILPTNHYLESWDDAEPKLGMFSLSQPVIRNLFDTRQAQDSLLKWLGKEVNYYQYIQNYWVTNILNSIDTNWDEVLQKGVFEMEKQAVFLAYNNQYLQGAINTLSQLKKSNGIELIMYSSVAIGKGNHTNNPWLMELPDPISKISWDNYASISKATADKFKIFDGAIVSINNIKLPVYVQPGQAEDTISVALGYGHKDFGKVGSLKGQNIFPLVAFENGTRHLQIENIEFKVINGSYPLAISQKHGDMEGRPIVRETTLSRYLESNDAGNEIHAEFEKQHVTLYKETFFPGHHWGMGVDLNKCVGCNTCVIACQAENNIPVVGKEEVMKTRIMHWMRVDRYYEGAVYNPQIVFQPLPCQHCDNAPCENVCPVSATNHSNEGLNQMAYNRCVGTKYCINNCPYKVRRFNWFRYATNEKFDFNMNSDLGRMVLNPDVTVRERGVVEKCTFCVQRIQAKKLEAKLENRTLRDGEILPACVQACPADALVFGDLNDPESKISRLFKDQRNYHLLEELHTLPSVGYLTLVRNKQEE